MYIYAYVYLSIYLSLYIYTYIYIYRYRIQLRPQMVPTVLSGAVDVGLAGALKACKYRRSKPERVQRIRKEKERAGFLKSRSYTYGARKPLWRTSGLAASDDSSVMCSVLTVHTGCDWYDKYVHSTYGTYG